MYEKWAGKRDGGMAYYSRWDDRLSRLVDSDGDGVFETRTEFGPGFNEPLDGTMAGVLDLGGDVWVTNILTSGVCAMPTETVSPKNEKSCTLVSAFAPRSGGTTCTDWCWGPTDGCTGRSATGDTTSSMAKAINMFRPTPERRSAVNWMDLVWRFFTTDCGTHKNLRLTTTATCSQETTTPTVATRRLVYLVEGGETGWDMCYQTLEGENRRGPWNQEGIWKPRHDGQPAWTLPPMMNYTSGPSGMVMYPGTVFPIATRITCSCATSEDPTPLPESCLLPWNRWRRVQSRGRARVH